MSTYISFLKNKFSNKAILLQILFWVIIGFVFYFNAFHEKYTDEFDNILGGWYILHGRLPYIGFFSHHGPVPYFLAGFLEIFSRHSFVRFRIVYEMFLLLFSVGVVTYLRKSIGKVQVYFMFIFIAAFAFISTYYWLHMLLADSLSAICIFPALALLFFKQLSSKKFTLVDIAIISICTFLCLLTALTYIYLALVVYIFSALFILQQNPKFLKSKFVYKSIVIFFAPYMIFFLYLLLTRSIGDYYYQSIYFNQKYYIYNYPGTTGSINPVRFAIVIAHGVLNDFFSLLVQVKDFNFSYPLNITFAIGNVAFFIYLLIRKKFSLALLSILVVLYANARTSPLNSGEHDYQSAVYIVYSLLVISYLLQQLYRELSEENLLNRKIILGSIFLILGVYSLFSGIFIFNKFNNRYFDKYMGNAPLIYDRPEIAPIINAAVMPNEYVWVGPLEYEELFYVNGRLASRYHVLNPGMAESPKISGEQIADLAKTKPNVIWYNPRYSILGRNPIDFALAFNNFLNEHYIAVYDFRDRGYKYVPTIPVTFHVDIEKYLYMRKGSEEQTIQRLVNANWLKKVPAK